MDDLEFAKRVMEGDRQAGNEFVDRHYSSLFRYLRVLTGHDQDAEDLAVETLLNARAKIRSFRGASSLRSWIHTIAFRQFLRWRRLRRFSFGLSGREAYIPQGFAEAEDAETLRVALAKLPDGQRQAFVLYEILEFDVAEVATALGKPVGTIKSRLHHARTSLRTTLDPNGQEKAHGTEAFEN